MYQYRVYISYLWYAVGLAQATAAAETWKLMPCGCILRCHSYRAIEEQPTMAVPVTGVVYHSIIQERRFVRILVRPAVGLLGEPMISHCFAIVAKEQ